MQIIQDVLSAAAKIRRELVSRYGLQIDCRSKHN
jgi:hypothetical protein